MHMALRLATSRRAAGHVTRSVAQCGANASGKRHYANSSSKQAGLDCLQSRALQPAQQQQQRQYALASKLATPTSSSSRTPPVTPPHLLRRTVLQQVPSPLTRQAVRAFSTAKVTAPIHETPHYMDFDTLVDMHLVTRQGFGDRPLFGTKVNNKYEWITYKEFGKRVDACRAAMAHMGIVRGDTVACISNNRVEWAVCAYATYSLGAAFVPMYEEQLPKDWRYIIENSDAKALFVATEKVYQQTFHFAEVIGCLRTVHCFDTPAAAGQHSFARLVSAPHAAAPAFLPHPDDLATLIYTSGTTGKPKGVRLTHGNLISNIVGLRAVLPEDLISCHDRSLSFLPWAHCYGQTAELHAFMAHGAALGIAEGVDKLLGNMLEVKPSVLFSVPVLFKKVYDGIHAKMGAGSAVTQFLFKRAMQVSHRRRMALEADEAVGPITSAQFAFYNKLILSKIRQAFGGNLKVSFVGGAATPLEVLSFFENIGLKICEGYGLTETSPLVSINTPEQKYRRLGSTGRALGGVTIKICMEGQEMGFNEEGEVCVSGPNVMQGYHKDPAATAEVFFELNGQKFFRTGDIGKLEDGLYLRITGRIKEQYKLENGKYVVPGPIEAALTTSRFITQALLFGTDKPFNVALLVPDWELLAKWAETKTDLTPEQRKDKEALAASTAVQNLIAGEVQQALEGAKKYEVPRKWELLEEGFTKERGMMTPKMSIKRHVVMKEYHDTLMHLYGDAGLSQQQREELKVA